MCFHVHSMYIFYKEQRLCVLDFHFFYFIMMVTEDRAVVGVKACMSHDGAFHLMKTSVCAEPS